MSITKFKIGDKVKCLSNGNNNSTIGKIYRIDRIDNYEGIDGGWIFYIGDNGDWTSTYARRFELIKSTKVNYLPEWL